MQDVITHFNFLQLATGASEMARRSEYVVAAKLWEKAYMCAVNKENRDWSIARCIICRKIFGLNIVNNSRLHQNTDNKRHKELE
ncbi:ANR family transcriptional regulator [Symbiopectobacterium sp. Eva_TO]|nr:ANR family transcriptional regulator [Candidatus Symbiopectobacterium sp.]